MKSDHQLLLRVLQVLLEKTEAGRIPWSESPREGRFIAVVNGQTFTATLGSDLDLGPTSIIVAAADEAGRRMWSACADSEAPDEVRDPEEIECAVVSLYQEIERRAVKSREMRIQHSLEALTAA